MLGCEILRITNFDIFGHFDTFFNKFIEYFFFHKRTTASTTYLTTVGKYCGVSIFHSKINYKNQLMLKLKLSFTSHM